MAKAARADEEPTPLKPDTVKIDLAGDLTGQWTIINREQTGRQLLAQLHAQEDFAGFLAMIEQRTIEHSFGGDILDQPIPTLTAIVKSWQEDEQRRVLDPTRAGGS